MRTPDEVATKLHGYLAVELETEKESVSRLAPFREAGWEDQTTRMVKEIASPIDGAAVKLFARYWPSKNEPFSVQFDQTGTEWFASAQDALEFVDEVIDTLENPKF